MPPAGGEPAAAPDGGEPPSCALACFPAGTQVTTPGGQRGIETTPSSGYPVGDRVLAEDPASGAGRPEAVTATIDDGVKPPVAVDLSDGSSILAMPNHASYVEREPELIRMADGTAVRVARR